jgi:hypothetical protein
MRGQKGPWSERYSAIIPGFMQRLQGFSLLRGCRVRLSGILYGAGLLHPAGRKEGGGEARVVRAAKSVVRTAVSGF